jgi:hypothetical protein
VPIELISGSLNLLEPSGPVKACNGITLPFSGDSNSKVVLVVVVVVVVMVLVVIEVVAVIVILVVLLILVWTR